MAEFSPLRTGAFVIRQHPTWRRRALLIGTVLGGIVALYLMYEWGRFEGSAGVRDGRPVEASRQASDYSPELAMPEINGHAGMGTRAG